MAGSLRDGLGGEEIHSSGAGMTTQSPYFTGSLTTGDQVSGLNVFATGSVGGARFAATAANSGFVASAGSPYGQGLIVPLVARSNISGGMFVACSGGLAFAAAASTLQPLGVAVPGTNVASGGTVNVILNGIAPVILEGTVAVGGALTMGAGGGLNCVVPYNVASASVSGARLFSALDSGTSGTATTIFIRL